MLLARLQRCRRLQRLELLKKDVLVRRPIAATTADALLAGLEMHRDAIDRDILARSNDQFAGRRFAWRNTLGGKLILHVTEYILGKKHSKQPEREAAQRQDQEEQRERSCCRHHREETNHEPEEHHPHRCNRRCPFTSVTFLGTRRTFRTAGRSHHERCRRFGIKPPRDLGSCIDVMVDVQIMTVISWRPIGDR